MITLSTICPRSPRCNKVVLGRDDPNNKIIDREREASTGVNCDLGIVVNILLTI